MKVCALLTAFILLGCSTLPPPKDASLFDDALFGAPAEPIDPAEIMAVSQEMKDYLLAEVVSAKARHDRRRELVDALYNRRQLRLDYDGGETRTAAQAFDDRAGNCLSLVLMTGALAKELGLSVQFQKVIIDDSWSRDGDLFFASGHVNLTFGPVDPRPRQPHEPEDRLVVDFVPAEEIHNQRTRVISERTVLAMFMNNRAAESLARGDLNQAYAWARASMREDPRFYEAYNTLGVIYLRKGRAQQAQRVLASVLAREPSNTKVMSNMVHVLQKLGRPAEAKVLALELARLEPVRPFEHFDAGVEEMLHGNYRRARALFEKELARESSYHEFHFWLALADYGLGDVDGAREHLALARDYSATPHQHDLYAAKLDHLKASTKQ